MRRQTVILLIVVAAVAVALTTAIVLRDRHPVTAAARHPAATAPAAKSPPGKPVSLVKAKNADTLVRLFFSPLQTGNWAGAYAYLSPDLQKTLGYQTFVADFQGSRVNTYDVSSLQIVAAGNFSEELRVPYTLAGSPSAGSYVATLRCVNITGGYGQPDWRVQSLSLGPPR